MHFSPGSRWITVANEHGRHRIDAAHTKCTVTGGNTGSCRSEIYLVAEVIHGYWRKPVHDAFWILLSFFFFLSFFISKPGKNCVLVKVTNGGSYERQRNQIRIQSASMLSVCSTSVKLNSINSVQVSYAANLKIAAATDPVIKSAVWE